ncbi:MAG: hypothetical protein DI589_26355 [Shinella sp.]|nr:MAG: hypothetical protein DI589_26355 [Shinella sp.]
MVFFKDDQSALFAVHPIGQPDVAQVVLKVIGIIVACRSGPSSRIAFDVTFGSWEKVQRAVYVLES